jgi:hypothetical protein
MEWKQSLELAIQIKEKCFSLERKKEEEMIDIYW